jgi:hypothetical protein
MSLSIFARLVYLTGLNFNELSQLQNQLIEVTPAKAKLNVHKAGVHKILKILDTVFRRYDAQGLLQLAPLSNGQAAIFWQTRGMY